MEKGYSIGKKVRDFVVAATAVVGISFLDGCATKPNYNKPVINAAVVQQREGDMYNLVKKVEGGEFNAYVIGDCEGSEKDDKGFYIGFYDKGSGQRITFPAETRELSHGDLEKVVLCEHPYDAFQLHTSPGPESEKDVVPLWIQKATERGEEYLLKVKRVGTFLNLYFEKKPVVEDNLGVGGGHGGGGGGVGGAGGAAGSAGG